MKDKTYIKPTTDVVIGGGNMLIINGLLVWIC